MCGFAGFLATGDGRGDPDAIATAMGNRIAHRGPDDSDTWNDIDGGIALAHRRLSIVDLSSAGRQPMRSASGRWVLAYNGEIYNHLALRAQLEAGGAAPAWRGHSDTETLLAGIEAWGVDQTLKRCVGMFAFALWDRQERALWLARDRIGEKPLYYGWQDRTFLFGSELKALRAHPAFDAGVDRGALALLLRHNYVPGPYSIYTGIHKLPPGTWLRLGAGQRDVQPVAYWSLAQVAEQGVANPFTGSDSEAVDALERHFGNAVRGQMMSDVPLGALLSGGVDSSLVAALMQAGSPRPVRTFTIGFEDKAYDEAAHARAVAAHLGTEHTEMRLSASDALGLVPRLPAMYDEPFADSSQLPTHLVMKMARQHVTVALSGDAGDEFFGGYNRYFLGPRVWKRIGWLPAPARRALGSAMTALPATLLNRVLGSVAGAAGVALPGDKAHKLGRRLAGADSLDDLYVGLVSEWPDAACMVVGGDRIPPNLLDDRERWPRLAAPVARMMALDGLTYLPDDILVKVDRASMAVSLETRAPFLDRDVMEFAWSLPMSMKLRDGRGKWILRQLLDRYVPRALIDRPKAGFAIPLDAWLRGPLRDWAETLLAEERMRREGYFDPKPIRAAWRSHVRGEASFGHRLWSVLMFQAWLEQQGVAR
jgi:asparagine synthase (glutamine-hydrolysing)